MTTAPVTGRRPQAGPPLLAPVLAFTALVRFGGLLWLVAVAALLPRTRPSRHQR
jgi:hypothetical protein